jgi:hypothetical protein
MSKKGGVIRQIIIMKINYKPAPIPLLKDIKMRIRKSSAMNGF